MTEKRVATDEELVQIFRSIDTSDSGSISLAELREAFQKKGLTEYETKKQIFEKLDKNGDHKVTLQEFRKNANLIGPKARAIFAWYLAFEKYDMDKSGFLSREQFAAALKDINCDAKPEEIDVKFKQLDKDGDHKIEFKEFIKWKAGKDFPDD